MVCLGMFILHLHGVGVISVFSACVEIMSLCNFVSNLHVVLAALHNASLSTFVPFILFISVLCAILIDLYVSFSRRVFF